MTPRRQMSIGTLYQGIGWNLAWADPQAGSQIAFEDHAYVAKRAEQAKLDFVFYAETLSLFEANGDVIGGFFGGRPDSLCLLPALASVTSKIGLIGTFNTTYHHPYVMSRYLGSVDQLSGGRTAWNMITSAISSTYPNFTSGDYLPRTSRYTRAREFKEVAEAMWWGDTAEVKHSGEQFTINTLPPLPRSPQGLPVVMQAGDSDEGREFCARNAEIAFTNLSPKTGEYYADVKRRMPAYGRREDQLKVLPGASIVVGDTDEEARERADHIRDQMATAPVVRALFERIWNVDLSGYDVDGPLPDIDPDWEAAYNYTRRAAAGERDARAWVERWRARAEAEGLTMRQLIREEETHVSLVGSYRTIGDEMIRRFEERACDGYILAVLVQPAGFDPIFDQVIPYLQERGYFREEYSGSTLRDHLSLDRPTSLS